VISRSILLTALFASTLGCTPQGDPAIGADGFRDDFERESLGDLWQNTGGPYEIRDGRLHVRGARNKPLWLRRVLPRDARVTLDVRSESPDGDVKIEVWGDGSSRATTESYTATSYVFIFGGWENTTNVIARMNEHGDDRVVGTPKPVVVGQTYSLRFERRGDTVSFFIDDEEIATMQDDEPLEGRGHDHFAFNNWQSDLWFDNLVIEPL
jgi:hypothetical protein